MPELAVYWAELRSASRSHLLVRALAVGGAVIFALSLALAGGGGPVAWAATAMLGLLVAFQPTTLMPVIFLLWAVGAWWAGVDGTWHWALLPAALALLLVHAAAALASSVPPQASIPESVLRLWAARCALVAGATAVVWLAAGALSGVATSAGGALPGIVGLVVLAGGLLGYVRLRPEG